MHIDISKLTLRKSLFIGVRSAYVILMDTLASRWAALEPHVIVVGPDDDLPRPAVLLFHGCGGLRSHLPRYAEVAKAAGWRAFIVDSYGPRGWTRLRTLLTVCTNVMFNGLDRAGDLLAAWHGVAARPDVDASKIVLGGWSHGGWSIMELMAAELEDGALGLKDAGQHGLPAPAGVWLAYAYVGFLARNRMKPWRMETDVYAVTCSRDHLTTVRNAERVNDAIRANGNTVESWIGEGTHAFDEPTSNGPMKHNPESTLEMLARFEGFLNRIA